MLQKPAGMSIPNDIGKSKRITWK